MQGRGLAQVLRGRPSLTVRPIQVLFVLGIAARELVFLPVLRLVPISIILLILYTPITFNYYRNYISFKTFPDSVSLLSNHSAVSAESAM